MCGILVVYSKTTDALDRRRFMAALALLGHRGPDYLHVATELDGRLLLAQSVLSICGRPDETFAYYGNSRSGRYCMVFNGETYNFRELHRQYCSGILLQTGSDAEVLSNMFDVLDPSEVCHKLEGMYAFVVFDRAGGKLHIARDTIGEKPLFRYEDSRFLVYSSELPALLSITGALDLDVEVLREYFLTRHFVSVGRTEFRGVEKVPAGIMTLDDLVHGGSRIQSRHGLATLISAEFAGELAASATECLSERLDVELGAVIGQMLPECSYAAIASGGVDSTLLAWYLAHSAHEPELVLGLDFDGLDPAGQSLSRFEQRLGRKIEFERVAVGEYMQVLSEFYAHHVGLMPTHSLASMSMLARRVAARGVRVLFGGDGADELFGGYSAYESLTDLQLLNAGISPSPYSTISELPAGLADSCGWRVLRDSCVERAAHEWSVARRCYAHVEAPAERAFQAMLLLDSGAQLESVGLLSSDRMAMRHSVEARSPYVHRRILRLALNLPRSAKFATQDAPAMRAKNILKRVFSARLGADLIFPKQGFPGFPNIAGRKIAGSDFGNACGVLEIPAHMLQSLLADPAMEWKLLNLELFLRQVLRRS